MDVSPLGNDEARGATAAAAEHDFYEHLRCPRKLKPGVGLDKIEQEGGPDAAGYERRTVQWWPRKGQDFIEVPEGAVAAPVTAWPHVNWTSVAASRPVFSVREEEELSADPAGLSRGVSGRGALPEGGLLPTFRFVQGVLHDHAVVVLPFVQVFRPHS